MQRYKIYSLLLLMYKILYTSNLLYNIITAWHVPDAVCTVLELLMMGGETARNMYSIDNNKEYFIALHRVGCTKRNLLVP
jgi:hypothetical protein